MAFDIFYSRKEQSIINEQLTQLFKANTLVQRPNRESSRKKISQRVSLGFQGKESMFFNKLVIKLNLT